MTLRALLLLLLAGPAVAHGHGGPIRALAVAPAGDVVVSGSFDASAIVWRLADGEAARVLRFHVGGVNCVAALPDGGIATGGLRSASCSQEAPWSNAARPSAAGASVQARPPMRPVASSTAQLWLRARSSAAAARPATPAPTTITSMSVVRDVLAMSGRIAGHGGAAKWRQPLL
jgi:hypothetical protein